MTSPRSRQVFIAAPMREDRRRLDFLCRLGIFRTNGSERELTVEMQDGPLLTAMIDSAI